MRKGFALENCVVKMLFREEFDKLDLSESATLMNQLVYTTDNRKVCLDVH